MGEMGSEWAKCLESLFVLYYKIISRDYSDFKNYN